MQKMLYLCTRKGSNNTSIMKKNTFLFVALVCALMGYAQQTVKVAVAEIVDAENKLSYAQKMLARSSFVKAISELEGYEAIECEDVATAKKEKCNSLLQTEAALTDKGKLVLAIKVLDVKSGKVEKTDNAIVKLSEKEIARECNALAVKLFPTQTALQEAAKAKDVITRIGVSKYDYLGTEIDKKEYARIMQTCPEAFRQYSNGKKLRNVGWGLLGGGMGMFAVGLGVCFGTPYNDVAGGWAGIALFSAGLIAACGVGIPLISVGYHRENNAYKIYNNKCGAAATPITFNLKADHNGLGIAMQF